MKNFFLVCLFIFSCFLFYGCRKIENNTVISYMTWGATSEIKVIKELILEYEKQHPTVKINLIHVPENYFQKLHLLVASNLTPDVIFINNLNARQYIKANKLAPLNSYLLNSNKIKKDEFIKNSFAPISNNNTIYAIPRDISNIVVYYNVDLFKKYNIKYPTDNWTQEEFLKTAQQLTLDKNNDEKTDIWGIGFEENSLYWLPFLWSNGGGILDNKNNLILNTLQSKEALQFYANLRNKYKVAPLKDEQASLTTTQLFLQEKIGMHLCGKWCSLTYKNNATFNWDVVMFPKGKNGSKVGLDVSGWAISANSKNKNEAWNFIEFLASDYSIEKITKEGLILPAKTNIANSFVFHNGIPQNSKAFLEATNNAIITPVSDNYSELNNTLQEDFETLFNGKKNVDDIIENEHMKKWAKIIK